MTERRPTTPAPTAADAGWDIPAATGALGTPARPCRDLVHGAGVAFRLGEVQPVDLELFPAAGVVRVTGGDLQLSLLRQAQGPRPAPEGLVFELPTNPDGRFLSVSPRGEVTLFLVPDAFGEDIPDDPRMALLGSQDAPSGAAGAATAPMIGEPIPGDPVPSEARAATPSPPLANPPGVPERDYVPRLTGRLARNPRFHENKKGVLVCEFDLGVKDRDDPSRTAWYAIAVFGERAEKLNGVVKQGDLVDVIGSYRHVREFTGRDGRTKRKEQYYATVVKLR
jgi:hypothetical protein